MPSFLSVAAAAGPAPGFLSQVSAAASAASNTPTFRELLNKAMAPFQGGQNQIFLFLGLTQIILIIALWFSSQAVADPEKNNFGNALKTYFSYLLLGVLCGSVAVLSATLAPAAITALQADQLSLQPALTVLGLGVLAIFAICISIYFLFAIPKAIYRIHMSGAVAFIVVSAILTVGGGWGLHRILGRPLALKGSAKAAEVVAANTPTPAANPFDLAEARAADRTKTIAERQAALKEIYDRLEKQRNASPPGDAATRAEYQRRLATYESLLNDLRAEVASRRGAP